jgi:hypothetical protein
VSYLFPDDEPLFAFANVMLGSCSIQVRQWLQGFAVAGKDGKYHWAEAVIDGDSVVVSSADVPKPLAVQYAWDKNSPWANLFNKDGLPALIFRAGE